ncbi:MAG TPA: SRPBCC family protein [Vicinamibacterales bacterium]
MKWILLALLVVVLAAAVVTCIGWLMPVAHQAAGSAEFSKPPDTVYALVTDVRSYPRWWKDMTRIEVLVDQPDRTTFRQYSSTGPLVMTIVERTRPTRIVTKIDDPDQPFGGTWTWDIAPTPSGGASLTITERGEIYNPVFRFAARYVFGYTRTIESCLAAIKQALG